MMLTSIGAEFENLSGKTTLLLVAAVALLVIAVVVFLVKKAIKLAVVLLIAFLVLSGFSCLGGLKDKDVNLSFNDGVATITVEGESYKVDFSQIDSEEELEAALRNVGITEENIEKVKEFAIVFIETLQEQRSEEMEERDEETIKNTEVDQEASIKNNIRGHMLQSGF